MKPKLKQLEEEREIVREGMMAAVWCTASPHEWTWNDKQSLAMAETCIILSRRLASMERSRDYWRRQWGKWVGK